MNTTPKTVQELFSIIASGSNPEIWTNNNPMTTAFFVDGVSFKCKSEFSFCKEENTSYMSFDVFLSDDKDQHRREHRIGKVTFGYTGKSDFTNIHGSFDGAHLFFSSDYSEKSVGAEKEFVRVAVASNILANEFYKALEQFKNAIIDVLKQSHKECYEKALEEDKAYKEQVEAENQRLLNSYRIVSEEESKALFDLLDAGEEVEVQVIRNSCILSLTKVRLKKSDGTYFLNGDREIKKDAVTKYITKSRVPL
ncbi:hypothetical protein [Vibrio metschnikovii]|uniref:Uncharacterized protein n=1 Tax=Vibrio metschnikovii TaxID=28172 RepID=A0A9X0RD86_VIBME|nr:hypothetical protein [Vibrio metschnikovii]EGR2854677.1 hypothetical protein [Vibrio parahaemolyticus]EGR2988462.1 hypothetical protein [Vibrio parahaemolyticus]EGR3309110.1 hypothetical protein [Vibrio parahaemolyticus]MBC5852791.1 hypothetical protein [Vibrio metschnikovii]